jgi:hypothetical protein
LSRLSSLRPCAAGLVVAACLLLGACGSGGGAASLPAPVHRAGPSTMITPSNAELVADPAGTLARLKQLGVDSVHLYMHWADIAPANTSPKRPAFDATNPAAYPATGWAAYDTIVRDTKAEGMQLVLDLVSPPPRWAEGKGALNPPKQTWWRPNAAEFGQFFRAVGKRYSGHYVPPGSSTPLPRVDFWSIWNEPNLGIELAPQTKLNTHVEYSGAMYRGLVDAAWSALQGTGHGRDTILIGEVGPAGPTFGYAPWRLAAMAPLRFLRALYCVDSSYRPLRGQAASQRSCPTTQSGTKSFASRHPGLFRASGFADHPYPQGLPPDTATPDEPDYTELAEVGKLGRTLDRLEHIYGSNTQYPIYSTEFGYQTTPPDPGAGTVSPKLAAAYLNWSEYLTWRNPRLVTYNQYQLTDSAAGIFATGLIAANGQPKPGFFAFRLPIFLPVAKTTKGSELEVWGCVRPAHYAQTVSHRRQQVKIQYAAPGQAFKTVATVPVTNRFGYFDVREVFPGSGNVRLAWAYPHGPQVFSRTVPIRLH